MENPTKTHCARRGGEPSIVVGVHFRCSNAGFQSAALASNGIKSQPQIPVNNFFQGGRTPQSDPGKNLSLHGGKTCANGWVA